MAVNDYCFEDGVAQDEQFGFIAARRVFEITANNLEGKGDRDFLNQSVDGQESD